MLLNRLKALRLLDLCVLQHHTHQRLHPTCCSQEHGTWTTLIQCTDESTSVFHKKLFSWINIHVVLYSHFCDDWNVNTKHFVSLIMYGTFFMLDMTLMIPTGIVLRKTIVIALLWIQTVITLQAFGHIWVWTVFTVVFTYSAVNICMLYFCSGKRIRKIEWKIAQLLDHHCNKHGQNIITPLTQQCLQLIQESLMVFSIFQMDEKALSLYTKHKIYNFMLKVYRIK